MVELITVKCTEELELIEGSLDSGGSGLMPVLLYLNLRRSKIWCGINGEDGTPFDIYYKRILTWDILAMTADNANELMDAIEDSAKTICEHSTVELGRGHLNSTYIGKMDDVAECAYNDIERYINEHIVNHINDDKYRVDVMFADEWIEPSIDEIGTEIKEMSADTLEKYASDMYRDAINHVYDYITVIRGGTDAILEELTNMQENMRDDDCGED